MIYFISDIHSNKSFPGLNDYLINASNNDLLIILGDLGLNFENTEENRIFTQYFLSLNKKIAFIDGNHENFSYLNSFPEEEWNGGTVGRLTENIVFLKRGNVYNIENKSFFVFGGCKSSPKWKEAGLWYTGEEPNDDEIALAYENFKKYNYKFNYILTHKYEETPGHNTVCKKLQELTAFMEKNISFDKWYYGHWHKNEITDDKHILIYDKLTALSLM